MFKNINLKLLAVCLIIIGIPCGILLVLEKANAASVDSPRIIGCINTKTLETTVPIATAKPGKECFYGKGWQNIMIPPASHWAAWDSRFTQEQKVNRLAIVNFESGFNPSAGNAFAAGYVQTLRKWKVKPDVGSQLDWLKKRTGEASKCNIYWERDNKNDGYKKGEDAVVACLYRHHYHAYKGQAYSRKAMAAREWYKAYFRTIEN